MTDMTAEKAYELLRHYNQWRRGVEGYEMPGPVDIGEAIDFACAALSAPRVPEAMTEYKGYVPPEDGSAAEYYIDGWNDCRDEMLTNAPPTPDPDELTRLRERVDCAATDLDILAAQIAAAGIAGFGNAARDIAARLREGRE